MRPTPPPEDSAFCRGILPRVSRTFALDLQLLAGSMRDAASVAYLLCRAADALEDSWPGPPADVGARFDAFLAALAGDARAAAALAAEAARAGSPRDDFALLARLPAVLRVHGALDAGDRDDVADGVCTLASGMRRYAVRAAARGAGAAYLDDERELHDYCYVVAGCVGEMLTRLHERRAPRDAEAVRARRRTLAPVVGEALQLTNILLDWPSDVRRGRCHVPARWLAERGLEPRDLVREAPEVRELAIRLERLAHAALDRVPDYLDTLPARRVRFRLFCLLPALWARASLRVAAADPHFPWGARRPRLGRGAVWREALRALVVAPSHRAVRRALAAPAPIS